MSLKGPTTLLSATFLSVAVTWAAPAGFGGIPAAPATSASAVPAIPAPPRVAATTFDNEALARSTYPGLGESVPAIASAAPGTALPVPPPLGAPPPAPAAGAVPGANPFVVVAAPQPAPAAAFAIPGQAGTAATAPNVGAPAFAMPTAAAVDGATAHPVANAVDERALRYYASTRDLGRVGAEIRRLKLLHPNWAPPADLFVEVNQVEEQPFWDRLAAGDVAGARAAIDAERERTPDWTPSADLTTKLADAEARGALAAATAAANWPAVIAAAQERPSLLVCGEMNALWQVGEAYARLGDMARAYDLYAYILAHCDVSAERLATWQKASSLLPPEGLSALSAFARTAPNGAGEFDSVRFADLRSAMGAVAAGTSSDPVDADRLATFGALVARTRSAEDAALIGWYAYGLQEWSTAGGWFQAAMSWGRDPKFVEGYVLSLRNGGDVSKALDLAYAKRAASPDLAKIYIEMMSERLTGEDGEVADAVMASESESAIDPDMLKRFSAFVVDKRSALGAQSIGWHLFNRDKVTDAGEWFEKSVDWKPTEEGVTGLASVAARQNEPGKIAALKARYGETFPEIADIEVATAAPERPAAGTTRSTRRASAQSSSRASTHGSVRRTKGGRDAMMSKAQAQFDAGSYEAALATLDQRQASRGKSRDAELLRGWANLKLSRWREARAVFKAQDEIRSTRDTRFGMGAVSNSQYRMWPE